jgi:hypothetical protein
MATIAVADEQCLADAALVRVSRNVLEHPFAGEGNVCRLVRVNYSWSNCVIRWAKPKDAQCCEGNQEDDKKAWHEPQECDQQYW